MKPEVNVSVVRNNPDAWSLAHRVEAGQEAVIIALL